MGANPFRKKVAQQTALLCLFVGLLCPLVARSEGIKNSRDAAVGAITDPQTRRVWVEPQKSAGIFLEGDRLAVRSEVRTRVRVVTTRGQMIYEGSGGPLPALACGHYFVQTEGDCAQFAVLPRDYHGASFLGTDADGEMIPLTMERIKEIQPTWARTGEGNWLIVQPRRGEWDWRRLDRMVKVNRGRKIISIASWRPAWVGEAEFIPLFTEYVLTMAERYRGKIEAIEIWNEPYFSGGDFSTRLPGVHGLQDLVDVYTKVLESVRAGIRAAAPETRVIGPSFSCPLVLETEAMARQGTIRSMDAFSWHYYWMDQIAPDERRGNVRRIDDLMEWYRSLMGDKSHFVDELGLFGQSPFGLTARAEFPPPDWRTARDRAIKITVMLRAGGAECIVPHMLWGGGDIALDGFERQNRGPQPKTSGFLMTCYWLDGATPLGRRVLGDTMFLYAWKRPDDTTLVFVWCIEGHSASFALHCTDVFGRPFDGGRLSQEPVLIQFPKGKPGSEALNEVERALRSGQ